MKNLTLFFAFLISLATNINAQTEQGANKTDKDYPQFELNSIKCVEHWGEKYIPNKYNVIFTITDKQSDFFDNDYPDGVLKLRVAMFSKNYLNEVYSNSFLISSLQYVDEIYALTESLIEDSQIYFLPGNPVIAIKNGSGLEDIQNEIYIYRRHTRTKRIYRCITLL